MNDRALALLAAALVTGCGASSGVDAETSATGSTDASTDTATDTTDHGDGDGDAEPLPNIDLTGAAADLIAQSVWLTTETFAPDHCAVAEGCVLASGERRLLRFSTYTPNVGDADFVVGSPTLDPERFEWHACHRHYHFQGFADYRLLDDAGAEVATGQKVSFSVVDLGRWEPDAGPGKYPLPDGTQGISVGWVDSYVSQLDCQWLDVTGVAPGAYELEIVVNPEAVIAERDYADNALRLPIVLGDQDDPPPGPSEDWTCPIQFYGALNGCDCGCGEFDPDCANPQAWICDACDWPGSCAEGLGCEAIAANDNATCG